MQHIYKLTFPVIRDKKMNNSKINLKKDLDHTDA